MVLTKFYGFEAVLETYLYSMPLVWKVLVFLRVWKRAFLFVTIQHWLRFSASREEKTHENTAIYTLAFVSPDLSEAGSQL